MTISAVSAAFGNCVPSVAEEELRRNPTLVLGIIEYRSVQGVLDLTKRGEAGAKVLRENPDLLRIIERIEMAQHSFEEWQAYDINERARKQIPQQRLKEEDGEQGTDQ